MKKNQFAFRIFDNLEVDEGFGVVDSYVEHDKSRWSGTMDKFVDVMKELVP